ncbi:Dabb family protein [Nocardioides pantholopis]|uniref:Dabb family protein n=1 Tax=Nocardioides pantholopis TaxID=2483798 RepID=UPI000F084693|nr:Dabb family protein [Nocardioides pantholopis]
MFQHIGVLTLTDSATAADKTAIADGLRALPGRIDGLLGARVVLDAGLREGNSDLLFCMDFDTRAAWEAYGSHPEHVAVVQQLIAPVLASKTFVQVEDADQPL